MYWAQQADVQSDLKLFRYELGKMFRFALCSGWLVSTTVVEKLFYSWKELQDRLWTSYLSVNILGLRAEGNVPSTKDTTVVLANHQSLLDWIFIKYIFRNRNVIFVFKNDSYLPWPINRFLEECHISISCKSTVQDRIAVQESLMKLPSNPVIVLFPEGNLFNKLHTPKAGALHELITSGKIDKIIDVTLTYGTDSCETGFLTLFLDMYPRVCRYTCKDLTSRFNASDTYTHTKRKLIDYWTKEKATTPFIEEDHDEELFFFIAVVGIGLAWIMLG